MDQDLAVLKLFHTSSEVKPQRLATNQFLNSHYNQGGYYSALSLLFNNITGNDFTLHEHYTNAISMHNNRDTLDKDNEDIQRYNTAYELLNNKYSKNNYDNIIKYRCYMNQYSMSNEDKSQNIDNIVLWPYFCYIVYLIDNNTSNSKNKNITCLMHFNFITATVHFSSPIFTSDSSDLSHFSMNSIKSLDSASEQIKIRINDPNHTAFTIMPFDSTDKSEIVTLLYGGLNIIMDDRVLPPLSSHQEYFDVEFGLVETNYTTKKRCFCVAGNCSILIFRDDFLNDLLWFIPIRKGKCKLTSKSEFSFTIKVNGQSQSRFYFTASHSSQNVINAWKEHLQHSLLKNVSSSCDPVTLHPNELPYTHEDLSVCFPDFLDDISEKKSTTVQYNDYKTPETLEMELNYVSESIEALKSQLKELEKKRIILLDRLNPHSEYTNIAKVVANIFEQKIPTCLI